MKDLPLSFVALYRLPMKMIPSDKKEKRKKLRAEGQFRIQLI